MTIKKQTTIEFEILNSAYTKVDAKGKKVLNKLLSYKAVYWVNGLYRKERKEYDVYLIQKMKDVKGFVFPTGLLQKCVRFLKTKKIPFKIIDDLDPVEWDDPNVEGITFRKDQERLIYNALEKGRGVIKAPTGSGKSIIIAGIISAFCQERILFLCHTIDLVKQMEKNLLNFQWNKKDIGILGGGKNTTGRIQMATIQSFARKDPQEYCDAYDVVIIDEVHKVSSFTGNYGKVLMNLWSPVKIGLTATLPYTEESKIALEGLVGPVIGEVTIQEGGKLGLLAKPILKMVKAPDGNPRGNNYHEIFQSGIVVNTARNKKIIDLAIKLVEKKNTVLINVRHIDHGERLLEMAEKLGLDAYFVHGESSTEEREAIKNALSNKKIKCVIASTIWEAGINIPSLNAVINAAGGKSDIYIVQTIGRGLRKTNNKSKVYIYDFYDLTHKWFRNHYKRRRELYQKNGWIK